MPISSDWTRSSSAAHAVRGERLFPRRRCTGLGVRGQRGCVQDHRGERSWRGARARLPPAGANCSGWMPLGSGRHRCEAVALGDARVCELPFATLGDRCRETAQPATAAAAGDRAERRPRPRPPGRAVAPPGQRADLPCSLHWAGRALPAGLGRPGDDFQLPMSRDEIARYLGLALERSAAASPVAGRRGGGGCMGAGCGSWIPPACMRPAMAAKSSPAAPGQRRSPV